MQPQTLQFALILAVSLSSYAASEAVEIGELAIVTTTTEVKSREAAIDMAYVGHVYKVINRQGKLLQIEEIPHDNAEKKSGWIAASSVEKYTGTVEQKLLMQRGISEDRKGTYPGLKFERKHVSIWEVPVEIEGKVHFVPFAMVKVRAWYESHPDKPFENTYVCAVSKKGHIPSLETVFYDPGLVIDVSIDPKIEDQLKSPRGPIKIPLED